MQHSTSDEVHMSHNSGPRIHRWLIYRVWWLVQKSGNGFSIVIILLRSEPCLIVTSDRPPDLFPSGPFHGSTTLPVDHPFMAGWAIKTRNLYGIVRHHDKGRQCWTAQVNMVFLYCGWLARLVRPACYEDNNKST